jgi:hypothetical protein
MPYKIRYRLSVNVTNSEYAAFMALAMKARTSPSALLQMAVRQIIADGENAIPLVPPASTLPEEPPEISYVGTWHMPGDDRRV